MYHRESRVTQTFEINQKLSIHWFVSTTTPGFNGEPCTLSVSRTMRDYQKDYKTFHPPVPPSFPNSETAFNWAFSRGYEQKYYRRVWCRRCRQLHMLFPDGVKHHGYRGPVYTSFCVKGSRENLPPLPISNFAQASS